LLRDGAVNIPTAVNQHASIEEAVFYMGAAPRLYNEDLRQLIDTEEATKKGTQFLEV
jgi:hypothetical protein